MSVFVVMSAMSPIGSVSKSYEDRTHSHVSRCSVGCQGSQRGLRCEVRLEEST